MSIAEASVLENQLPSRTMKHSEALKIEAAPLDPLSPADGSSDGFGGYLPTIFVIVAVSSIIFGVMASGSAQPLLLTVIAVFAMLGIFMVFGILAGHVRLGDRVLHGDVVRAALDASATPVVVARVDGAPIYWNGAHETMFGRSEDGPLAALELAAGRGGADNARAFFRLMRAGERGETREEDLVLSAVKSTNDNSDSNAPAMRVVRVGVTPFKRRDLHATPVKTQSTLKSTADAKSALPTSYVQWVARDVTEERRLVANTLGDLNGKLALFDSMPAGFIAVGGDGTITYANATFEVWLGYMQGGLNVGRQPLTAIAGTDGSRLLAQIAASENPEHRVVELDLTRIDGRVLPLTLFVEPLGEDGGFSITATARAATSAGALGDASMMHFFQSAPFGIATLTTDGRIAASNTAMTRMANTLAPVRDQLIVDLLCANAEVEERRAFDAALGDVLSGRAPAGPVDITAGDAKQFSRRIYMAPLVPVSGDQAAALYVVDATEQKALETRVAQAQKMEAVGNLAGGIAHDFNNVLTAIIGLSDLLLQTHRTTDPSYKDIKSIQSAAKRAADLVANLLGFSRKQTQQVSVLNLGELVSDNGPLLKSAMREKIFFKTQAERDLWYVRADSSQVLNVILNLSRNACDAMPNGGTLTVSTRNVTERESHKMSGVVGFTPGEYVAIEVADTGTGMSPEVMAKIFEPFFTTKAVGKGTGLGLASVYGIVKQSGGFIYPESELGKGTTFKVLLPRHVIEDDEVDSATATANAKALAKKKPAKAADLTGTGRVLLVEDEVDVRRFAVRALTRQGYQVLEAADGVEALDIMNRDEKGVDIVVSDVVMPEMDGPTLFKELRKRNPSMKVIFVSGYPNEAFRETLGTDDFAFLPKPFSLPDLAAKVKEELAK